ncbi:MAG TPA: hypothetical protein VE084_12395 [Burkholderiaceae bacterium]|nr:hypothetical protein [Pseudomonadota bacterium]MDQ7973750.1 hypothetical protein [Rhodocyclaceae bacterium]MDQ8001116.1 hypothetical protein [Pseudomonadota bacterium]MDQ8019395.1 hypothetical protein [Pseudomonadota bacterium]HZF84297.1 hypothetical protein [Burkholderiaceae bacterium]
MAKGMNVDALSDSALARMAWERRREALHGDRHALRAARELDKELRRRDAIYASGFGALMPARAAPRAWWQFWH